MMNTSERYCNEKFTSLRDWDLTGLIHNVDLRQLSECLSEAPTSEVIAIYKALSDVIYVCLRFANIPVITTLLTELSYAYSLELTNRFLINGEDIGKLTAEILNQD